MKFRLISDEPLYIDFDEFRIKRWAGYGGQTNFSLYITTRDGKEHVVHTWVNPDQLKHLHEMIVTIPDIDFKVDDTRDTIQIEEPVPVESITIERKDGSKEVIKND